MATCHLWLDHLAYARFSWTWPISQGQTSGNCTEVPGPRSRCGPAGHGMYRTARPVCHSAHRRSPVQALDLPPGTPGLQRTCFFRILGASQRKVECPASSASRLLYPRALKSSRVRRLSGRLVQVRHIMSRDHVEGTNDSRTFWLDEEMVELSLLLPGWQAAEMESLAHSRGMTLGQLLRLLIRDHLRDRGSSGPIRSRQGSGGVMVGLGVSDNYPPEVLRKREDP
jgi:hypothetical protein